MELSESIEKRKKQQRNYLFFITFMFIVIIITYGILYFVYHQNNTLMYFIGSILLFIVIVGLGWTQYYYQKKKDKGNCKENISDKTMMGINIAQGVNLRLHSFAYTIAAIIFLLGGVYSLITYRDTFRVIIGILLLIMGIALVYVIINDWKVSKIKLKGRNY